MRLSSGSIVPTGNATMASIREDRLVLDEVARRSPLSGIPAQDEPAGVTVPKGSAATGLHGREECIDGWGWADRAHRLQTRKRLL